MFVLQTDRGCMTDHVQVVDCTLMIFWIEYVQCSNGRMMFSTILGNAMHVRELHPLVSVG